MVESDYQMIIQDRVYGEINITNKLIIDLINSSPMQRLKKIKQGGPTTLIEPQRNQTRFEHSIGVWYLLHKFGASLEEQVAGLLHDTPHTAFSHVADVVFPNVSHSFHEKFEEKIILASDVPSILTKHKMKIEEIFNKSNFHLLEVDLPDLSADRIDYFLRDTRIDPIFPSTLIDLFLKDLFVVNSKFCFKTKSTAVLYTILFMDSGKLLWLDANSHGAHGLLGEALKRALKIKLIIMDDLFKTDDDVLIILQKSKDKLIKSLLKELSPKKRFIYTPKEESRFWGPNKVRFVDPYVKVGRKILRVTELYPEFIKIFSDFKNAYQFIGVK